MIPRFKMLPVSRDLRNEDQQARGARVLQALKDLQLEAEWRRRVKENPKERQRLRVVG